MSHIADFRAAAISESRIAAFKQAVFENKISPLRYENYKRLYEELKQNKKY